MAQQVMKTIPENIPSKIWISKFFVSTGEKPGYILENSYLTDILSDLHDMGFGDIALHSEFDIEAAIHSEGDMPRLLSLPDEIYCTSDDGERYLRNELLPWHFNAEAAAADEAGLDVFCID